MLRIIAKLQARWRALFGRFPAESDLEEELRYHLDKLIEENRAAGMSETDARAAALKSFRGLEQAREACREAWGARLAGDLRRDLQQALRTLRRRPALSAAVVLSLALGMGANATIFGLVNAVFWRPLPVSQPEQLMLFSDGTFSGRNNRLPPGRLSAASYRLYERLRDGSRTLDGLVAQDADRVTAVVRSGGEDDGGRWAGAAAVRIVRANYFEVLGVRAHRGRPFGREDEGAPGTNAVLVLSYPYWQRRFGGDPTLIGRSIRVEGRSYRVIGITAPGFNGTEVGHGIDLWVPMSMQADFMPRLLDRSEMRWLFLLGRLQPGVALAAAQAEVNLTLQRFLAEDPVMLREAREPRRALRRGLAMGQPPHPGDRRADGPGRDAPRGRLAGPAAGADRRARRRHGGPARRGGGVPSARGPAVRAGPAAPGNVRRRGPGHGRRGRRRRLLPGAPGGAGGSHPGPALRVR
jgi:hypothetical protein